MLYPINTGTRTVIDISGMWKGRFDFAGEGLRKKWWRNLPANCELPVPSSWNDLFVDNKHRNHMGPVWYAVDFVAPAEWRGKLAWLRFNSVTHRARVWVNGALLGEHEGGYTPFEFCINAAARFGRPNKLVVYADCILSADTIPQGNLPRGLGGYAEWHETNVPAVPFDFFPYGGIHRPVQLYCTNSSYLDDVSVNTRIKGTTGFVDYEVKVVGNATSVSVNLGGKPQLSVLKGGRAAGTLAVSNCRFWSPDDPHLYEMKIAVIKDKAGPTDEYALPVGVRTVKIAGKKFLLNGKPVYFKGFGRHEDFFCMGKAQNLPVMTRDYELMKWIGANSYRTSHYPYSEEQMRMADRRGIMVCVEAPSVTTSMRAATGRTLANHIAACREMYQRDKNHPCVVMWSVADENEKGEPKSLPYFTALMKAMRKLEKHRPISHALTLHPDEDKIGQLFDFIIFNIYACWYGGTAQLETLEARLKEQVGKYWKKFRKPILIGEFGAECLPGIHTLPATVYSEEYQCELLEKTIAWFRKQPYIIGEHIWVFADFNVAQSVQRVVLNNKGVFTRDRQPKMAAHLLKKLWAGQKAGA